jgi:dihydrodipicolinate synthase/N-acetylneuraminate lyase
MTTNLLKKSIFAWNISAICGGDVQKIAATIKAAGFQSAILHSTNLTNWRTSPRITLVKALKALGVEVVASATVYGANPAQDGLLAAAICKDYELSTFVFDVESIFDAVEN